MLLPLRYQRGQIRPFPSVPRIDWSHPLAAGLLFYHYDFGAGGIDLAGYRQMTQHNPGTPLGRASTKWGTTYRGDGSASNGVQYASNPILQTLTAPVTWAVGFSNTANPTESGAGFFGRAANNIASAPFYNWGFLLNNAAASDIAATWNKAGAQGISATKGTLSTNTYNAALATAPGNNAVDFYLNGTLISADTASIANTATGDNIVLYTDFGGPNGFAGNIYWGAFWSRALGVEEIYSLYVDPYSFLLWPEDDIYAELVGAQASTPFAPQIPPALGRRFAVIGY